MSKRITEPGVQGKGSMESVNGPARMTGHLKAYNVAGFTMSPTAIIQQTDLTFPASYYSFFTSPLDLSALI